MGVTIEKLDKVPMSCGNCLQLKIVGKRGARRVAKCVRGRHDDRVYVIDSSPYKPFPEAWDRAFGCPDFYCMIDNLEIKHKEAKPKEGTTWTTLQRHL